MRNPNWRKIYTESPQALKQWLDFNHRKGKALACKHIIYTHKTNNFSQYAVKDLNLMNDFFVLKLNKTAESVKEIYEYFGEIEVAIVNNN